MESSSGCDLRSKALGQFLFCGELGGYALEKKLRLPSLQSLEKQLQATRAAQSYLAKPVRQVRSTPSLPRVAALPSPSKAKVVQVPAPPPKEVKSTEARRERPREREAPRGKRSVSEPREVLHQQQELPAHKKKPRRAEAPVEAPVAPVRVKESSTSRQKHRAPKAKVAAKAERKAKDLLQEAGESEQAVTGEEMPEVTAEESISQNIQAVISEELPQVTKDAFEDLLQEARESEQAVTSEEMPEVMQEAFEDVLQETGGAQVTEVTREDLPQVSDEAFEDLITMAHQRPQDFEAIKEVLLEEAKEYRESEQAVTSEEMPEVTAEESISQNIQDTEQSLSGPDNQQTNEDPQHADVSRASSREFREPYLPWAEDPPATVDQEETYDEEEFYDDEDFDSESQGSYGRKDAQDSDASAAAMTADSFATPSAGTDAQESSESFPVSVRDSSSSRS